MFAFHQTRRYHYQWRSKRAPRHHRYGQSWGYSFRCSNYTGSIMDCLVISSSRVAEVAALSPDARWSWPADPAMLLQCGQKWLRAGHLVGKILHSRVCRALCVTYVGLSNGGDNILAQSYLFHSPQIVERLSMWPGYTSSATRS
jgi:hypothetical protein